MTGRGLRATAAVAAASILTACGAGAGAQDGTVGKSPAVVSSRATHVLHLEYVFVDGRLYVYDIDHGFGLVQRASLPGIRRIRGAAADIPTHMLYVSHGGDGGGNGHGALAKIDLLSGRVIWDRWYARGIDSFAVSSDGTRIYMPDGELSPDGVWSVLGAGSGRVLARINAGRGAHNTVLGLSGRRVYLGGRDWPYLDVVSTSSNRIIERIGRLRAGVRPFTINGHETLAFTTATGFLGFQVSSITTGRLLYTRTFGRWFRWDPHTFHQGSTPSHGISLSPDERQAWVIDAPNSYVHVFDVSALPQRGPQRLADVKLIHPLAGMKTQCSVDCARLGWLQHSLSGCLVFVGDSGDVIRASSSRVVGYLPAMHNSRVFIEIDWRQGRPVATSTRTGLGYVTREHGFPDSGGCR